jgi:hypothetical protein
LIGIKVQNHDIATGSREHAVDTFFSRFEMNLKIFAQDRGENLLQFWIFRVQAYPDHVCLLNATLQTITGPFQQWGESRNHHISA